MTKKTSLPVLVHSLRQCSLEITASRTYAVSGAPPEATHLEKSRTVGTGHLCSNMYCRGHRLKSLSDGLGD